MGLEKKIFEKNDQALNIIALPLGPLWGTSCEIYSLCSAYPKDTPYEIWKELAM